MRGVQLAKNIRRGKEGVPLSQSTPLQPQIAIKKTLVDVFQLASGMAFLLFITLSFLISFLNLTISSLLGICLIILGGSSLAFCIYEYLHFQRYFYDTEKDVLVIRKGVFTLSETTLPYGRIQDVFVDQDVLDQALGLYDLHLSTATMQSGLNANIDGLSFEGAEKIKKLILGKMLAARNERR